MNLILLAKSGSGKDRAREYLVNEKGFSPIISHTTRPMRDNEVDKKDYHFISEQEFDQLERQGGFLETRTYNTLFNGESMTYKYGTAYSEVRGDYNVMIKDLNGAIELKHKLPDVKLIYIYVDEDIRKERAMSRGNFCETEWSRRLCADEIDFDTDLLIKHCDYYIDNNSDLDWFKRNLDKVVELIEEDELYINKRGINK